MGTLVDRFVRDWAGMAEVDFSFPAEWWLITPRTARGFRIAIEQVMTLYKF